MQVMEEYRIKCAVRRMDTKKVESNVASAEREQTPCIHYYHIKIDQDS